MKIHYTIRGSPGTTEDWKNIKPGTKVIIYEGWNTKEYANLYYGKVGIVAENKSNDYKTFKFCFTVAYGEDEASIYPYKDIHENREVRGIILK